MILCPAPFASPYLSESHKIFQAFTTPAADARKKAIDTMVRALKTAGVWSKLDLLYVMAAATGQAAQVNWISPGTHDLTAVNSPTFTADQGYAGDGASSYLVNDVNFSALSKFTQDDSHLGVWVRSGATNNNALLGAVTAVSAQDLYIVPARASTAVMRSRMNNLTGVDSTSPVTTPVGHSMVTRGSSSGYTMYKDAASVGTPSAASIGVPAGPFNIGRASTNGGAPVYNAAQVSAAHVGSSLSSGEVTDLYNALSAYLTSVGAI